MTNGVIGKVTAGGGTHLVTSTFYGTCATAANTVAKIVKLADATPDSATLITGMTLAVKFTYSNTATNPTLTVQRNANTTNLIAAKNIKQYGTTAPGATVATSWRAGAVVLFIYDGTNWVMVSGLDDNTTYDGEKGITLSSGKFGHSNTAITAQTTQALYPIKIDAYGHITAYGTAVTVPAAVSVKGNAESSYRTGQVNLTPANLGISATTTSVTVGNTTFNKYTHPTSAGYNHIPSGGSSGQFLKYDAPGTAYWANLPYASASQSGVVSTGTQTFAGDKTFQSDKFTVQASAIRIQNKAGNTSQALSGTNNDTTYPYVTSLMLGDGREVTFDEYRDGYLGIHSKYGMFIQSNSTAITEYDATQTYSVGALVWHNGIYYRCTTAITTAEAWTSSHWTQVPNTSGTIVFDGNIQPLNSGSQSLGTSNYRWEYIYGNLAIQNISGTMPTSTSGSWTIDSSNKTVTISDSKIKTSSILYWTLGLNATQAQYEAFAEAQFVDYTTSDGSATIKALGDMPTIAIPIRIYILGESV